MTRRLLRGSGYLGYVDSNQGYKCYNLYKWVICLLTRVLNLHITSYIHLLSILNLLFKCSHGLQDGLIEFSLKNPIIPIIPDDGLAAAPAGAFWVLFL